MYAAWHPSSNFFAIPLRTNDIGIVSKDSWAKQTTFANGHRAPVTELAWSPNGRYLASAAGAQILVWNTESRSVVAKYTNVGAPVTGLAWSPTTNMLAFTDIEGSFHRWNEPVPSDLPSPVLSDEAVAKKVDKLLDDGIFGEGDEDLEEKGDELGDGDEFGDDWIIDDDGGYAVEDDGEDKWAKGRTEVVNVTKAQDSFVPGSTQWKNKKRYLGEFSPAPGRLLKFSDSLSFQHDRCCRCD
jgi:chromosome transmission fidelity protein 4